MANGTKKVTVEKVAPWATFLTLPLLVAPWFLDFAQEAKTLALQAAAGVLLLGYACGKMPAPARSGRVVAALVAIFAASCLSSLWAPGARPAFLTIRNEWTGILAALLLAAICDRKQLAPALFAGAAAIAILGILQVACDWRGLTPHSDPGQFPGVTFGNRGLASLFVALGIMPGLWLISQLRERRGWIYAGLAAQSLFVMVAMTRAVWLGIFGGFIVWAAAMRRRKRHQALMGPVAPQKAESYRQFLWRWGAGLALVVLCAAALVVIIHNDALKILLAHRLDPANWLQNPRLELWHAALARFFAAGPLTWIFGFGPGAFQVLAPDWLMNSGLANRVFLDLHNDPLQYLLEFGIVGGGLRFALIAYAICRLWKKTTSADVILAPLTMVCLCNAVILLLASLFFFPLRLGFFIMLLTFFLADPEPQVFSANRVQRLEFRGALLVRGAAMLIAIAAFAGCWQRAAIETAMRTYVRDSEPYFKKIAARHNLEEKLAHAPVPQIYLKMLHKGR